MNNLRKAAALIPGHWMQGELYDRRGNRCGLGHLLHASGISGRELSQSRTPRAQRVNMQISLLDEVAHEKFRERYVWDLVEFNDHADTTEEDVVMVFEHAALRWEVEHPDE